MSGRSLPRCDVMLELDNIDVLVAVSLAIIIIINYYFGWD
jgi:hypothetical protein